MQVETIILAAGKGSRMNSSLPKVLHPIAGKPMLGHVVDTARKLENNHIYIVVGHGAEQVKKSFSADEVFWVEQEEQLGTGHAVLQALPFLDAQGNTLVLYGDVPLITLETLQKLIKQVDQNSLVLLTTQLDNPQGYGRIVRDKKGGVIRIVEQKDASQQELEITEINTGIMAANTADLKNWLAQLNNRNAQKEYYLTDIVEIAKSAGKEIRTCTTTLEYEVQGVNDREQQAELEKVWQKNKALALMKKGVSFARPESFTCRGNIETGEDVFIDVNVLVEGNVTLGNGVIIGANSVVIDSEIADGVIVKPFSHIEGAHIGEQCEIGPYARIRPGTVLSRSVKIGNFVETKKAVILAGSKVNHLSYIGDAEIGENCNIGAGTITCNYDGIEKFRTTLGNHVFIGSNNTLVAPLNLDDYSFTAAGSCITGDVEKNALAIARTRQKNIKNWKRPDQRGEK
ncbi:MAG: bifunctional UDP-N-acetylglucosamine diphosphorylase/glucosamine-1-phosphate N-acetyltransferase GlmU [Pseudomonadales bacterium]|nr:bifunctional UDP-N-acetylglucosamine diphosphorylase/glucosamine-1-phosphate N-acetyltransferase GlmU [Pseudomonadales bacterium]